MKRLMIKSERGGEEEHQESREDRDGATGPRGRLVERTAVAEGTAARDEDATVPTTPSGGAGHENGSGGGGEG